MKKSIGRCEPPELVDGSTTLVDMARYKQAKDYFEVLKMLGSKVKNPRSVYEEIQKLEDAENKDSILNQKAR